MKVKATRTLLRALLSSVLIVGVYLVLLLSVAPCFSSSFAADILTDTTGTETPTSIEQLRPILGANVADIDQSVPPVAVGNLIFFSATDGNDGPGGYELWRSDGTEAGTVMVRNINATAGAGSNPRSFVVMNGVLFFTADNGIKGRELWRSDGTLTTRVKDINSVVPANPSDPAELTVVGSTLYLTADDGIHGRELWKSDGTSSGTVLVKDINPNVVVSYDPTQLTAVGTTLYFTADDGVHGVELWKSSGTAATTLMVNDINTTATLSSSPDHLTAVGSSLFFVATNGTDGRELWKTKGTASTTRMMKDINSGGDSLPRHLTVVGTTLYFSANGGASASEGGRELWKSDGTSSGTIRVKDINPGAASSDPTNLTAVGATLFFSADNGTDGLELWRSDGTADGTVMLGDINPFGASSNPRNLIRFQGRLIFSADDNTGEALRRAEVTGATTTLLSRVTAQNLTRVGTSLFFVGNDGTGTGNELWITNGEAGGTSMIRNINESGDSNPSLFTPVNDTLFFTADDGKHGVQLWTSNGTFPGTVRVSDTSISANSSNPLRFRARDTTLFFTANNGTQGRELWRSDGSPATTRMINDIFTGAPSSDPTSLAVDANGTLYFAAVSLRTGRELWKSDGTNGNTVLVRDIVPGTPDSFITELTPVGTTVFFSATTPESGAELWKTDGTTDGTVQVIDIVPGTVGSSPRLLTSFSNRVFFVADDGTNTNRRVLWRSNGLASSATPVLDSQGNTILSPAELTAVGSSLFFSAEASSVRRLWRLDVATGVNAARAVVVTTDLFNPQNLAAGQFNGSDVLYCSASDEAGLDGVELWRSDGTTTVEVLDIDPRNTCPGPCSSSPQSLVNVNGTLFFTALTFKNGLEHGRELWRSDGTAAGTVLVRNINGTPGVGSEPNNLTALGSILLFTANDGNTGVELWRSDGTATRTKIVKDIAAAGLSSSPENLLAIGGFVYFSADNGVNGRELWRSDGTNLRTRMLDNILLP